MARTAAVIPVRALEGAKSRLGDVLDAEERRDLVARLLVRTVEAARAAGIEDVLVVTDDPEARTLASDAGAIALTQRKPGLNQALDEARRQAVADGARVLVVLPVDLPLVDEAAVTGLVAALGAETDDAPTVVLVPDRHGTGTNALALRPPDVIRFAFGASSRAAHEALAAQAGARYVELDSPLAIDLDTPEDLLLVEDRLVGTDVA
ncbi:MAG TPA: 2-phospho-L-lactate guanylyltransferase [Candidatus Limnocylindrales bacterium]|nr:2-phospho-L-lactate guanylyltransferase [Candidatus Limnocylindrales bacterium]